MHHTELEKCIEDCLACMKECNVCFDACLNEEDTAMLSDCIRFTRECAEICAFAASAMSRNSPFYQEICQLCAAICRTCGEECQKHAHHHEHCKRCADVCKRCAESCLEIAQ